MVSFSDGWETGQTWTVLWGAVATRVAVDPFEGSWCLQMDDADPAQPAGVSKDGIFDAGEDEFLRIAIKNVSATHAAEVYIYKPDHSKVAFTFGVGSGGDAQYVDNLGSHTFYDGDLNTWYEFRIVIRWVEQTFDILLFDKDGNWLASVMDRHFYNGAFIATICHILLYSAIGGSGTAYYDGVSVETYVPPPPTKLDLKETGILLGENLIDPPPEQGYWIVGYWLRKVRNVFDKTLGDDHNIPRAILNKIKDIESQKP